MTEYTGLSFEEKVRSMTAREIIMAMVTSLKKPPLVNVDMNTYGDARMYRLFGFIPTPFKVCFGCAATNTICQIAGKKFTTKIITDDEARADFIHSDKLFLDNFEMAIDALRRGSVQGYNGYAERISIPTVQTVPFHLPTLNNNYTDEDLIPYVRLAEYQRADKLCSV